MPELLLSSTSSFLVVRGQRKKHRDRVNFNYKKSYWVPNGRAIDKEAVMNITKGDFTEVYTASVIKTITESWEIEL